MGSGHRKPSDARARKRRGVALILTLLVLAILIVITVQFAYSVKTEELVVENTKDDITLKGAAHGAVPFLEALFRDDRTNGKTPAKCDTLVDVWSDPKSPDFRKLTLGDTALQLEIEDLDRRLSLAWFTDDKKAAFAQTALVRLMQKCKVDAPDIPKLAKNVQEWVRKQVGKDPLPDQAAPGAPATPSPAPGPSPTQTPPPVRPIFAVDQLLEVEGMQWKYLHGDPEAKPEPTIGIARFLTTWPTDTLNLNTMLAEVMYATLPEKNQDGANIWEPDKTANDVVDAIRKHRIDPEYQTSPPPDSSGAASSPAPLPSPGQGQGVSKSWNGTAFEDVQKLQDSSIHQLLGSIFTKTAASASPVVNPANPTASPIATTTPTTPAPDPTASGVFNYRAALGVESRYYAVKATVTRNGSDGAQTTKIYRLIVARAYAATNNDSVVLLCQEDSP